MSKFLKISVSIDELEKAVALVLFNLIKNNEPFTAYDVTKILRDDAGPIVEILHDDVRELVHSSMATFYALGVYDRIFNHEIDYGKFATLYKPTDGWESTKVEAEAEAEANVSLAINIPRVLVDSSLVYSLSYTGSQEAGTTSVTLKDNMGMFKTYSYANVPFSVFLKVLNADSVGHEYNSLIKNKYERV